MSYDDYNEEIVLQLVEELQSEDEFLEEYKQLLLASMTFLSTQLKSYTDMVTKIEELAEKSKKDTYISVLKYLDDKVLELKNKFNIVSTDYNNTVDKIKEIQRRKENGQR